MKILAVFLLGALLAQGITAEPEPFFGDIAKGITNGIGKIGGAVGGIVSGVVEGAGKLVNGVLNTVQGIVAGVVNATVGIISGVAEQVSLLTGTVMKRLTNLTEAAESSIKSVISIGGSDFRKISDEIKGRIRSISSEVNGMMAEVEEKFNEGLRKINATLDEKSGKIEIWVSEIKNKYANVKDLSTQDRKEIDELMNNFVKKSSQDLSECAEEIVEPLKSLHDEAQGAMNNIIPVVEEVITDMTSCIKGSKLNPIRLTECAKEAKRHLPTVSHMGEFTKNLKNEIASFRLSDILDMSCMGETMNRIGRRKDQLDSDIGDIVNKR